MGSETEEQTEPLESIELEVRTPDKTCEASECKVDKMSLLKFIVCYTVCFIITLGLALAIQGGSVIPLTYYRGFDLSDRRISMPHRDSRVSGNQNIGITIILLYITVIVQCLVNKPMKKVAGVKNVVLGYLKKFQFVFMYTALAVLYGMVVTNFFTNLIKTSAGVLKPHFLDVCKPNATLVASLNGSTWVDGDLSKIICTGDDDLQNYRRSFPSGHASQASYSMIMAIIVVHATKVGPEFYPLKALAQLLLALYLNFICFDRLKDHHHNWYDVLAGLILGLFIALVTSYGYIRGVRKDLFQKKSSSKAGSYAKIGGEDAGIELK